MYSWSDLQSCPMRAISSGVIFSCRQGRQNLLARASIPGFGFHGAGHHQYTPRYRCKIGVATRFMRFDTSTIECLVLYESSISDSAARWHISSKSSSGRLNNRHLLSGAISSCILEVRKQELVFGQRRGRCWLFIIRHFSLRNLASGHGWSLKRLTLHLLLQLLICAHK